MPRRDQLNPENLAQNLIGAVFRRVPVKGPAAPFDIKDTKLYRQSIEQATKDYESLIGGLLGLGLGPGGRERAAQAYRPIIHPAMKFLGRLGMDPYAGWRKGLYSALELSAPGPVGQAQYENVGRALGSYFAGSGGGLSRAAAGFRPAEQARVLQDLVRRGLPPNPVLLSAVLQSVGAISEMTRSRATVDHLERIIGPLTYWRQNPYAIEPTTRARLGELMEYGQ